MHRNIVEMQNIQMKEEIIIGGSSNDEDMDYYPYGVDYNYDNYDCADKENVDIKSAELSTNQEYSANNRSIHGVFGTENDLLSEFADFHSNQIVMPVIDNFKEEVEKIGIPFHCDICQQRRFTKHGLMKHRFDHTAEDHYTCLICFKTVPEKRYFSRHIKAHSRPKKIYSCDICSKCFNCQSNLNKHKRTHITEKRYKCDICQRQYTQNSYLTIHKREHTGEEPFQCDNCPRRYRSKNTLTQHKKTHHKRHIQVLKDGGNIITSKGYECVICHARFVFESSMVRHIRLIHQKGGKQRFYKCNICDKKFNRNDTLKVHLRIHTDEKHYECDICYRKFSTISNMYKHKPTHDN